MAIVVNVGPNNLLILENFLFKYCESLTENCKTIPLFINCDSTMDNQISVAKIEGFEEVVSTISSFYGVDINIISDRYVFGHDRIMDNFMHKYARDYDWILFVDDDVDFIKNGAASFVKNSIIDNNLSCFGLVDLMGIRGIPSYGEWVCAPSIGSNFIGVKVDDYFEMNSTFKRMYEGHFRQHQLPLHKGIKMFAETCCFYTMDLLKNEKNILDVSDLIDEYFFIDGQGSNRINKSIRDVEYFNELLRRRWFYNFGFNFNNYDLLDLDPWIKEINYNKLNSTAAYTFDIRSPIAYEFNQGQMKSILNNQSSIFDVSDEDGEPILKFKAISPNQMLIQSRIQKRIISIKSDINSFYFYYLPYVNECNRLSNFHFSIFVDGKEIFTNVFYTYFKLKCH